MCVSVCVCVRAWPCVCVRVWGEPVCVGSQRDLSAFQCSHSPSRFVLYTAPNSGEIFSVCQGDEVAILGPSLPVEK